MDKALIDRIIAAKNKAERKASSATKAERVQPADDGSGVMMRAFTKVAIVDRSVPGKRPNRTGDNKKVAEVDVCGNVGIDRAIELSGLALPEGTIIGRRSRTNTNEISFDEMLALIFNRSVRDGECIVYRHRALKTFKYGLIRFRGAVHGAHRLVCQLIHGAANGRVVAHSCDNPGCINPKHISFETYSKNTLDAIERGLIAHRWRTVNEKTAKKILNADADGMSHEEISKILNVKPADIAGVISKVMFPDMKPSSKKFRRKLKRKEREAERERKRLARTTRQRSVKTAAPAPVTTSRAQYDMPKLKLKLKLTR